MLLKICKIKPGSSADCKNLAYVPLFESSFHSYRIKLPVCIASDIADCSTKEEYIEVNSSVYSDGSVRSNS